MFAPILNSTGYIAKQFIHTYSIYVPIATEVKAGW